MAQIKSTGLNRETLDITTEFFKNVKNLDKNDPSNYQLELFHLVEKFFKYMNRLGELEFASFLAKHQFDHYDPVQQEKYTDAFNCLVAFIVEKYNESDLLRYFLPKEHSIENKPQLTSDSWRIVYWAKFLTYWLGSKLFNRQKFIMQGDKKISLKVSIAIVKGLHDQNYFDLNQNAGFKENLDSIVQTFVAKRKQMFVNTIQSIQSSSKLITEDETQQVAQKSEISSSQSTTSSFAPPPPPAPPFAPILPSSKTNLQRQESIVATSGSDRDNLLAAIRDGIKLKKVEATAPKEVTSDSNNLNLHEAIKNALLKKFKNVQDNDSDNENESNKEGNHSEWDGGGDVVDSAGEAEAYFELENKDEADAMMKILQHTIPQNSLDFDFIAEKIVNAFDLISGLKSQSEQARKHTEKCLSTFFSANNQNGEQQHINSPAMKLR
ncbi:WH2 domain-containing protein [Rickettsiella endosymbiont of Xylota segnis]|uniref:WH2 domain-containing protein n=1 Tax=Rickettsiella endosymbiont of Xylota segnis TaxID=3066238 RepID=UPI0030CBFB39